MNLFKAIGFKLISALLFAAMSALVRRLLVFGSRRELSTDSRG